MRTSDAVLLLNLRDRITGERSLEVVMESRTGLLRTISRAFSIMFQQFKREIGVAIILGQAKHKMARIHYVRATEGEAKAASNSHHSENRWRLGQNSTVS